MEVTSIRQFLESFCDYSHWKYAVFWKLNQQLPTTLIWGDGYCNYPKTNAVVEGMLSNVNIKGLDEIFSSSCESNGSLEDYSAQLLMTEMSNLEYNMGEGAVGKIAVTGEHFWVTCEDIFTSKFNTNLIPECPYEWLLQFASGIKTIVLVPVLPQGIMQFGSTEVVSEDLTFVAYIEHKFNSLHCMSANTTPLSSDINIQAPASSTVTHNLMDNFDESFITNNILECGHSDSISLEIIRSTRSIPTVPLFIQDEHFMSGEAQQEDYLIRSIINEISFPSNGICSYLDKDLMQQEVGATDVNHKDCKNSDSLFSFPLDSELQKALGPVTDRQTAEHKPEYFTLDDTYSCSTLVTNKKELGRIEDLHFPKKSKAEYLSEILTGNLYIASDDISSGVSDSVISSVILQKELICSARPKSPSEESTLGVDISDPRNDLTSEFMAGRRDDLGNPFTSAPLDHNSSFLIDETQHEMIYGHIQPNSGLNLPGTGKKRAGVDNIQRPRPRDRQMIMDRMKELRELIPDAARCSIDSLLDRTIKHMLYLRNITNRVEKLKQCKLQEVRKCKKRKTSGNLAGRTCPFDLESELQVCPIVIEDLECPGHMLIEMICSEHGLFLEIAELIQRLDLTILKGVLERRSNATTLAQFIVEAPRGFYGTDVLCPLLHYLQFRRNTLSSLI